MLFLATFVIDSVPYYGEALRHSLEVLDLVVLQTVMSRGGEWNLPQINFTFARTSPPHSVF